MAVSESQWHTLLDHLFLDKELSSGQFLGPNGKGRMAAKWEQLASRRNAMGCATKTGVGWKTSFTDLKSRARKAYSTATLYIKGTGGSPPLNLNELGLSAVHVKCMELLSPVSAVGNLSVPNPLQLLQERSSKCVTRILPKRLQSVSRAFTVLTARPAVKYSPQRDVRQSPYSTDNHYNRPHSHPYNASDRGSVFNARTHTSIVHPSIHRPESPENFHEATTWSLWDIQGVHQYTSSPVRHSPYAGVRQSSYRQSEHQRSTSYAAAQNTPGSISNISPTIHRPESTPTKQTGSRKQLNFEELEVGASLQHKNTLRITCISIRNMTPSSAAKQYRYAR